jgi:hypothetical protein
MKLAIMQPYFFPYLGYFQAIHAVDKYILYENFNYPTEGWMSRNRLIMKYNQPFFINALVKNKSPFKKIHEIELLENNKWKKKLLKALFLNYKGSVFFDEIYCLIESIILFECEFLHDYNANGIKSISQFLQIKTEISIKNSSYVKLEYELDHLTLDNPFFKPYINLINLEKKVARIIAICKMENSTVYINAIGGRDLYDKNIFKENGIDIFFVNTKQYKYKQFSKEFISNLSIIDVLMHNGKEGTKKLIENYNLI